MLRKLNILFLILFVSRFVYATDFDVGGYVNGLYIPIVNLDDGRVTHTGLINNRLNFKYIPTEKWTFTVQLRNRLMMADYSAYTQDNFQVLTQDEGFINLSFNVFDSDYFFFNTFFDRLNVAYNVDKWSLTLGRQRINWSQTLVFNPNDIFNGYSFFDYDYPERQGSDAVRACYFPDETSVMEIAAKLNSTGKVTAAAMYRFNYTGFDIQALTGVLDGEEWLVGMGFSGDLKGLNLRGEASFFQGQKSTFVASVGADWLTKNALFLSGELLYNQQHQSKTNDLAFLYQTPMSAKHLSFSEWSMVLQASYPFSSICSATLAAIWFIDLPMFYVGPSIDWSVKENLSLSLATQFFISKKSFQPSAMGMGYVRLRYNF